MFFAWLRERWPLRYIRAQILEIANDRALRFYGVALALVHVWTFLWLRSIGAAKFLPLEAGPLCWPLLPCEPLHLLGQQGLERLFFGYAGFALLVALLFGVGRVRAAWWALLTLNLLAAYIVLLDYRLRLNQHYMAFWVAFSFLFLPSKRNNVRVLIVLFYVWAGMLKLNWEWISGAALYRPVWFFTGRSLVAACAYVVVLELAFSWGVLAKNARLFWFSFVQLLIFHVFSWPVVGFFYPMLMFSLLTLFPLARFFPAAPGTGSESLLHSLFTRRERRPLYALVLVFSVLQLIPYALPGDRALTGEGRLLSLHMFDALVVCDGRIAFHGKAGGRVESKFAPALNPRERCDPYVFHSIAKRLCRRSEFSDLDLRLQVRRKTDSSMRTVVDIQGFCSKNLPYNPFWHNPWILTE